MTGPQPLFLAGLGRSGTTALAELFSAHPRIAVGMERYKLPGTMPGWKLTREDFDRERFFDFSDGRTNITPTIDVRWKHYYDALDAKFDDVAYVGDKITHLRLNPIMEAMPDTRVVCIIRNVYDVAASWQARADNPKDKAWNARRGAEAAVQPWNDALVRIARARRKYDGQVALIEYDRLYSDPDATSVRAVIDWLGLEWEDTIAAEFDRIHQHYVRSIAPKERTLDPAVRAYADENADLTRWKRLSRKAL